MKNRRIAIIAFVLVAVMAIGVGYAAVSDTLGVNGTIGANSADEFKTDVFWQSATVDATAGTKTDKNKVTAEINDDGTEVDDLLVINVQDGALVEKNDAITVTATIVNNSDLAAKISVEETTAVTDAAHFSVVIAPAVGSSTDIAANGGTAVYTITITLTNSVADAAGADASFAFKLTVEANS